MPLPDAEASVSAARKLRLDSGRRSTALSRARSALSVATYHEGQASAMRAQIRLLARTWDLCERCVLLTEECQCPDLDSPESSG